MEQGYVYDNNSRHFAMHHTALMSLLDPFTEWRISNLVGSLKDKRCLDVGTGAGSIATWLADQVGPGGEVVATDLKLRDIPTRENLAMIDHDITSGEPLGGGYDLIHARLLLNHLPQRRHILHRLVNELRPGGVLLTQDYSPTRSIDLVIYAKTLEDAAVIGQYQAAHYRLLTAHGNDRAWSRQAPIAMMEENLTDVEAVMHGQTWRGGSPGCQFLAASLVQLHEPLMDFGMTAAQLNRVHELLLEDTTLLLHGHILYSTSGRKA